LYKSQFRKILESARGVGTHGEQVKFDPYKPFCTLKCLPELGLMSVDACSIKGDVKEHFSPCTGGVDVFRDIQPLSPRRTLVWCRAPWFGLFHISGFIFLGCDDAGGF
jgi:hypothetical protein